MLPNLHQESANLASNMILFLCFGAYVTVKKGTGSPTR